MSSALTIGSGSSLTPPASGVLNVTTGANVTGLTLQAGWELNQTITIMNESGYTLSFDTNPATSLIADSATESVIPAYSGRPFMWNVNTGLWHPLIGTTLHGSTHQEIVGTDQLVNFGLFERIARVVKTTSDATVTMFSGISNNADNTLQAGHGWTLGNSPSGNLNYTGDFIYGSQCIKLVSNGSVTSATVTSPRLTALDVSSLMIRVWLKLDAASYTNLNNAFFYVGSGATQFLNFANTQFTGVGSTMVANGEYAKPGEWVCYTFNPASFVNVTGTVDWTALQDFRVSVKDAGSGNATILFGGIDFVANDAAYPHGVVSLTFDDSYVGAFTIARPKMEQYGYKGTFYLINSVIGTNNGTYMTQSQITQLQTLGHELAAHSYYAADHNTTGGFPAISVQELLLNFGLQKGYLHTNGFRGVNTFAYPQGLFDTTLLGYTKQQFACARTTTFRSIETFPVADPYRLRSLTIAANSGLSITPNSTPGTVEWYLDQIYTYGGWLIIYSHDFVASGASGTQTNQTNWNTVIDYIATKGIPVRTVGDVLGI